jgi:hypothetical protein
VTLGCDGLYTDFHVPRSIRASFANAACATSASAAETLLRGSDDQVVANELVPLLTGAGEAGGHLAARLPWPLA